jgi:hypothetical protein
MQCHWFSEVLPGFLQAKGLLVIEPKFATFSNEAAKCGRDKENHWKR